MKEADDQRWNDGRREKERGSMKGEAIMVKVGK